MQCSFTIDHYKEIIQTARDKGYVIFRVCDIANTPIDKSKFILLRHDIDFSLEYAYELANIEYDLGVQSSYYIYLHSPTYNALSPENMNMIKSIKDMGHEIGLHYDSRYGYSVQTQSDLLVPMNGDRIDSITQHWPAVTTIPNEYDLMITNPNDLPIKYISDSGRNWREKCLCQHLGKEKQIHVSMHPEWWVSTGTDRWDALNKMYQSFESQLSRNMTGIRNMISDYEKEVINKK